MKTVERSSIEEPEPKDKRPRQGFLGFLGEVPGLILMAFVLALIIRTFLFQAFFIPSPSMEPTLQEGDRVLVNKIPYYFHDPRRGDIIVFENPNPEAVEDRGLVSGFFHWRSGPRLPTAGERGLHQAGDRVPGDVVMGKGRVVNGENWMNRTSRSGPSHRGRRPGGQAFVMGDNRGTR